MFLKNSKVEFFNERTYHVQDMYESEKMSTFSMFIYLCVNTNSILKRGLCGTRQVILKSMWRKKEGEPRNCENKEK